MDYRWHSLLAAMVASFSTASASPYYQVVILQPNDLGASRIEGMAFGQVVGYGESLITGNHAIFWNSFGSSYVDLTPAGGNGKALACDGIHQVGEYDGHAALWAGTAQSFVDLNPVPGAVSLAEGVSGSQQVGLATYPNQTTHAILWTGTAASYVDLNPVGYSFSAAAGTNGADQVGTGAMPNQDEHALLWHGTADSAVDLNPPGASASEALAICGTQIAGRYSVSGATHAIIWNDLGASYTDLNPPGYDYTELYATSGEWQAGDAFNRAMVWHGTATSAVDLSAYLPSTYSISQATGVDSEGNVVGYAYDRSTGQYSGVIWLVPEPPTAALALSLLIVNLNRKRTRARRHRMFGYHLR